MKSDHLFLSLYNSACTKEIIAHIVVLPDPDSSISNQMLTLTFSSKPDEVVVKIEEKDDEEEDFASKDHHILVEFISAVWYVILSHTDFICYAMVFLNQVS